jgi:AcrR family transcriptional regulator
VDRPPTASARPRTGVAHKRAALLEAALELFARDGLQSVPTSAISRAAGVATGTLFVYFESKEQLINELYLGVASRFVGELLQALAPDSGPEARLRQFWFGFARWHLENGAASRFALQCEVASVLSTATKKRKEEMEVEMAKAFFPGALEEIDGSPIRYVAYAMIAGPIQVLAQMRDKGEIEITEELLEMTFQRVARALRP